MCVATRVRVNSRSSALWMPLITGGSVVVSDGFDADTTTGPVLLAGTNPQFKFVVTGDSGGARLSGSIALDAVSADPRALEPLLGVRVRSSGESWVIAAE